jgi:hypothetical protein
MGRHEKGPCPYRWGVCDARSGGAKDEQPHVCGGGFKGHGGLHICEHCLVQQA